MSDNAERRAYWDEQREAAKRAAAEIVRGYTNAQGAIMRRIDRCGRDITDMPGLHSETDMVELAVQIPAEAYEYLEGLHLPPVSVEFAAGCHLHLAILQMQLPPAVESCIDKARAGDEASNV